jgi:hypothetical protein
MSVARGRWSAPLAASAAVLATVVLPGVLARGPGGGAGPDRVTERLDLTLPGHDSDGSPLRITGYQAVGRDLTVYYKVSPRSDCSTAVVPPAVRETGRTVAVRLVRAPMSRPDGGCAGRRRLNSSVEIRLDRPMNGRLLADLTHHGELVTPAHAAP